MDAAGVRTARSATCATAAEVAAALDRFGAPHVVKDDGLAAGKGVVVTADREAALAHAEACDGRVVLEEFLDGPEVSLFVLCDGTADGIVPLLPAQDSKRLGDGDTGPNTGGMGAYAPTPWTPRWLAQDVVRDVVRPVVEEMARRGSPFAGLLYVGLALTADGPQVVEFNVRFGDPETQAVLALLETPLGGLLRATAEGRLADEPELRWRDGAAVTVVLAAPGYPGTPLTGGRVDGLEEAEQAGADAVAGARLQVLHAGTRRAADGGIEASGGRVLSVTATAATLADARRAAYAALDVVDLPGGQTRRDVAQAAAAGEVSAPSLR